MFLFLGWLQTQLMMFTHTYSVFVILLVKITFQTVSVAKYNVYRISDQILQFMSAETKMILTFQSLLPAVLFSSLLRNRCIFFLLSSNFYNVSPVALGTSCYFKLISTLIYSGFYSFGNTYIYACRFLFLVLYLSLSFFLLFHLFLALKELFDGAILVSYYVPYIFFAS